MEFDVVIIGSGPNGLAAGIVMQQQGLKTLILESRPDVGGGLRTAALTLPGFSHDVCATVFPMAAVSPFFSSLPPDNLGIKFLYPEIQAAHPLDNGDAGLLFTNLERTAAGLGEDAQAYLDLFQNLIFDFPDLIHDILSPLKWPGNPGVFARFGLQALPSAKWTVRRFKTDKARALFGGMAGHAVQPLGNLATSAIALTLVAAGHVKGWPVIAGGSGQLANALISHFQALGGTMQTNFHVENLKQIPSARAYLFDTDPAQMLRIAGNEFSASYRSQLQKFRHGMGVFKIDWALSGPIPFINAQCRKAVTVHIGNTFEEIHTAEWQTSRGAHPERPFIILVQPGIVDPGRAPEGKQTAWAYCHVPAHSTRDMTQQIENQIERFAPGFKTLILAKSTTNTMQLEQYNPNYVGGDISGGMMNLKQLFFRPAFRWPPYRTSSDKIFICSASTPPGGGVHGMCGYHAARTALRDVFGIKFSL